jgi:predicted transcriptional regulator
MTATIITIESALTVLAQLTTLIQSAYSSGKPIDAAAWQTVINSTQTDLKKLDADLAAGK